MLLFNLTFGIIANLLLLLNCLLKKNIYWLCFLIISILYYILDTCLEAIKYKRYMYIPHHILSTIICICFFLLVI